MGMEGEDDCVIPKTTVEHSEIGEHFKATEMVTQPNFVSLELTVNGKEPLATNMNSTLSEKHTKVDVHLDASEVVVV